MALMRKFSGFLRYGSISLTLVFLMMSGWAFGIEADVYKLDGETKGVSLKSHFSYLEDQRGTLSLSQVQESRGFKKQNVLPRLGYSDSVFWGKLTLENQDNRPRMLFLTHDYASTDTLTAYFPDPTTGYREQTQRDHYSVDDREIKYRTPLFKFELHPGQTTLYFRIDTISPVKFNFSLWQPQFFWQHALVETLVSGSVFGLFGVMIFYNLFLCLSLKSLSYLYYVGYISSVFVLMFFITGFAQQYAFDGGNMFWLLDLGV